jgi:phospholipid-binding lipoprotein MlaA
MNLFHSFKKSLGVMALGFLLVIVQGCATGPNANPADPMEPLNRAVFNFNDGLDRALLQPVATAYDQVTPSPVKTGVRNFFGNIADVWSVVNNLLQGKLKESVETLMRVSVNSTFGFGGVLDIGSEAGLSRNRQDFGQTLGVWGFDAGPYVVLPLFGPSSVRDTVGTVVDGSADVVNNLRNVPTRNSLAVLRVVDKRAELLGATNILGQAALDKYSFTRDLYLQRRASSTGKDAAVKEERFDLPAPPAK